MIYQPRHVHPRYFVLITMSTIGYGDLTPKNQLGYAIVILIIIAVVSVFPWMISGIIDALAQAKGLNWHIYFALSWIQM